MLDFELARRRILEHATPLPSERVELGDADGRVLAVDVVSDLDLPPFDYSAMDGYALAAEGLSGSGPWRLRVDLEQRAGAPAAELQTGKAARIFTGAPLPHGANAVVMQEDTEREGDEVVVQRAVAAGSHVRRRGEDLARGARALTRGTRLNPFQIGLLAALDQSHATVSRRPKVSLLCTGDELRDPGSAPRLGSIPDSNGPSLSALARRAGAEVTLLPRTGDELEPTRAAIRRALAASDVLLTVGGVSVGDHDLVKQALEAEGVMIDFWKVKIKPGKPLAFGRFGAGWVLGLPGNPVSAQLTLALFGVPLLRALQGDSRPLPTCERVRLASSIAQKPGRLGFYRARSESGVAYPLQNQASGAPNGLASADVLVLVPAESSGLEAGAETDALRLADL
jgi:molybdopterin molybdotransferase